MIRINPGQSALDINSQIILLQDKTRQNGDRFLQFNLNQEFNALLPLGELQGVIDVKIEDILPVPQVKEFWLGIFNWRGQAIWILDLANLIGANHWCKKSRIKDAGILILVRVEERIIGAIVEEVSTIAVLDPNLKLPLSESMMMENWGNFFTGYFLDRENKPLMLLDLEAIFSKSFKRSFLSKM